MASIVLFPGARFQIVNI